MHIPPEHCYRMNQIGASPNRYNMIHQLTVSLSHFVIKLDVNFGRQIRFRINFVRMKGCAYTNVRVWIQTHVIDKAKHLASCVWSEKEFLLVIKYVHAHILLNLGTGCRLKRAIQFLFEGSTSSLALSE